jgi:hypothetical protein
MPGSHIPIIDFEKFTKYAYDFIVVLPWNIVEEVNDFFLSMKLTTTVVTSVPKLQFYKIDGANRNGK